MLLHENWGLAWAGLAISIGVIYFFRAFRDPGQEVAVFPAVILLVTGVAILSQIQGWTSFEMWRIWPIFFGSIGLGLALLWVLRGGRMAILVVSGIFLIGFGHGFGSPSWYRYLRDMRHFFDYWPLIVAVAGLILLIGHGTRKAEGSTR